MPATEIPVRLSGVHGAERHAVPQSRRSGEQSVFHEVLDTVNPLQHVPGVSQGYRAITKDRISDGARLAGHVGIGAAVGGPVGAAIGAGVFFIESLFGAIFGKGGSKSDKELVQLPQATQADRVLSGERAVKPGVMRPVDMTAAEPRSPLQMPVRGGAPRAANGPAVEMSSEQFTALLSAFGGQPPMPSTVEATPRRRADSEPAQPQPQQTQPGAVAPNDFAARMAANLEKLEAMKRSQTGQ